MNKQQATRLLKHFDEDEVKIVAQAVNDLGTVSKDTVEAIIEEFARDLKSGANLLATTEKIQSLLEGVISPDQIAAIISKTGTTSAHAVWQRLHEIQEHALAARNRQPRPACSRPCRVPCRRRSWSAC